MESMSSSGYRDSEDSAEEGVPPVTDGRMSETDVTCWLSTLGFGVAVQYRAANHDDYCELEWFENCPDDGGLENCARYLRLDDDGTEVLRTGVRKLNSCEPGPGKQLTTGLGAAPGPGAAPVPEPAPAPAPEPGPAPEPEPEPEPESQVGWWLYQAAEGNWVAYSADLSLRLDERLSREAGRMPPDILDPDVELEPGSPWYVDLNQMRQVPLLGTLPGQPPPPVRLCPTSCDADTRAASRETAACLARASPVWLQEQQQEKCMRCSKKFGEGLMPSVLWREKYCCRYCGWVVCAECIPWTVKTLGIQMTLPVDRWISSQTHTQKFARPAGTRKEKKICKSCFEFAPTEVKGRVERIEKEAVRNYERHHALAEGSGSLNDVLRSSKGVGGWAEKVDYRISQQRYSASHTRISKQRLSDITSGKVATAVSQDAEPFFSSQPLITGPRDGANHTHTLIVLHGFTGTAESMLEPIVNPILSQFGGVRCVLPTAPRRVVSCYAGTETPHEERTCWYDYYTDRSGQDLEEDINEEHVADARTALLELVEEEIAVLSTAAANSHNRAGDTCEPLDLPPANERVFVLGYSQGGCMALDCAMTVPYPLGGAIGLRCHLMSTTSPVSAAFTARQHVLMYHGEADTTISCKLAQRLAQRMVVTEGEEQGGDRHAIHFETEPGLGHGELGGAKELACVSQFLESRMGYSRNSDAGDGVNDESEIMSLLCYGDSLTAGYHSYDRSFNPYARHLICDDVAPDGSELQYQLMCNPVGACGATAQTLVDNADSSDNTDSCGRNYDGIAVALQKGPEWDDSRSYDYCVIMAGTNDLSHISELVRAGGTPVDVQKAVVEMVEHVKLLHQRCHAVGVRTIALPIPPSRSTAKHNPDDKLHWQHANELLQEHTASNPMITFIDMVTELPFFAAAADGSGDNRTQQQYWEDDGLHLSQLGSAEFGRVLRKQMVSIGLIDATVAPTTHVLSTPSSAATKLRGLPKYGNYCFVNAALQCLRQTPTVHSLLTAYAQAAQNAQHAAGGAEEGLLQVTAELFAQMTRDGQEQNEQEIEEAIDVAYQRFVASCSVHSTFTTWAGPLVMPCARPSIQEQQDAGEFFDKLLDTLASATDPATGVVALARLSSASALVVQNEEDATAVKNEDAREGHLLKLCQEIGQARSRGEHAHVYSLLADFAQTEWLARDTRVHTTARTHLGALFQGQQIITRRCFANECSYINFSADPSLIAEYEVRLASTYVDTDTRKKHGLVNLKTKLCQHFRSHRLARDHRCPSCQAQGTMIERNSIFRLPEVMVVRVGRIDRRNNVKMSSSLDFPNVLSLEECLLFPERPMGYDGKPCSTEYQLFAVCFHTGPDARSGHYTSVVRMDTPSSLPHKSHETEQAGPNTSPRWALIDDNRVETDCRSPQAMETERGGTGFDARAFMLFYCRCRLQVQSHTSEEVCPTTDIFDPVVPEPIGAHRVDRVAIKNETQSPLLMYWRKLSVSESAGTLEHYATDDNDYWKKMTENPIEAGDVHRFRQSFSGHAFVFKAADTGHVLDGHLELHDATMQWYSLMVADPGQAEPRAISVVPLFDRPDWDRQQAQGPDQPGHHTQAEPLVGTDVQPGDEVRIWSVSRRCWVLAEVRRREGNRVDVEYVYERGCGKWVECDNHRVLITKAQHKELLSKQQRAKANVAAHEEEAQLAAAIQASLESANHVHREPFDEVTSDVELKAAIAASLAESKTAAVSRESVD